MPLKAEAVCDQLSRRESFFWRVPGRFPNLPPRYSGWAICPASHGGASMSESLPVVILVGGAGTRLGRGGEVPPKALVEVGDRPILWHVMKVVNRAVGERSGSPGRFGSDRWSVVNDQSGRW